MQCIHFLYFGSQNPRLLCIDVSLPNNSMQFILTFGCTEMKRLFLSILISSVILCIYALSSYLCAFVSPLLFSLANPTACWDSGNSGDQTFEHRTPQRQFETWIFTSTCCRSCDASWRLWLMDTKIFCTQSYKETMQSNTTAAEKWWKYWG